MKKTFDFSADINKKNKEAFFDALPIGNGHLGAMIYGDAETEKIILNDNTFWLGNRGRIRYSKDYYTTYKMVQELLLEHKTQEAERLASLGLFPNPKGEAIYTVAGQLNIQFPKGQVHNYQRTLHLDDGYVGVEYNLGANHILRRYFASYPNDILGIEILTDEAIEIVCQLDREKQVDSIVAEKNGLHLMTRFNKKDVCHIRLYVEAEDVKLVGASLIARGKTFHLWISMATTLYHTHPNHYTKKRIHAVLHQGYVQVLQKAKEDYKSLFERQKFSCNDQDMEYMYNFSRYLMISSSRDSLPANLQGLWNQEIYPAWDSKYTININLEMNYWNVFSANLVECFQPLLKLLEKMYPNGKQIAKKLYHTSGFVAHHNTDIYGDCGLQDHYLPATIWPLGAAWLSQVIFDAYTYLKDISILKRYGYILEEAARFILNLGIEDKEGYFVLCPSLSPENSYMDGNNRLHMSVGCTMDDQIIYDLFTKAIQMNHILERHVGFTKELEDALGKIRPLKKSQYGTIQEWHEDFIEAEPGHRHISHLYGLYPSNQIIEGRDEFLLAKETLSRRLAHGGGHTGWSKAWITAMFARLKSSEAAYQSFQEFMKNSTSRIGLDLHPPFQIDGNFGIAAAIKEMLLYETEDYIEIFPAKPKAVKELVFTNILMKGNMKISLFLSQHSLRYVVESMVTRELTIRLNHQNKKISLKKGTNTFVEEVQF